jgi:hypothetical protein
MSRRRWLSLLASGAMWLIGCKRKASSPPKPVSVPVDSLAFPAMWVFGDSLVKPIENAGQLKTLHLNYIMREDSPFLVDSSLKVYRVSNLRSTKSGAWQMLNPNAAPTIAFELTVEAGGIDAVRKLVLACKYLGSDTDAARRKIEKASTLSEIIDAVQ